ncbi:MAG TPA: outer membrane beta-barrel protein [Hyphomicrobium sp.]|nr:outer membrane beta-barrel protein [Hyphomicrobium sp.]
MSKTPSLIAASALAFASAVASAAAADLWPDADMDLKAYNWTGFSIAPYFGYETLRLNGKGSAGLDDPSGWRVGGEIDYDRQFGNLVLGVSGEAYYTWYDANGKMRPDIGIRMTDYGTLRGKVGYASGRWLVYGTGGWAFGEMSISNAGTDVSDNKFLNGWTVGAGAEWVWKDQLTIRGEIDHMAFGSKDFSALGSGPQDVGADLDLFKVDFITRF